MKHLTTSVLTITLAFGLLFASQAFAADDNGEVARGVFTTDIEEREPVDTLEAIPAELETVYFFTDLRNFMGETVTHRWVYDGETAFELSFDVGGPRWRTWSAKTITETQTGIWSVEIVVDGEVFESFEIEKL